MRHLPLLVHWLGLEDEALTEERALRVADALKGRYRPMVSLGGGLLRRPWGRRLLLRLDDLGLRTEVALAASGLRPDRAWELAETRVDTVVAAVYGPDAALHDRRAGPGAFDRLRSALAVLESACMRVRLEFVADAAAAPSAEDVLRLASRLKADVLRVCPVVRPKGSKTRASEGLDADGWGRLLDWYLERAGQAPLRLELEPAPHGPEGGREAPKPAQLTVRDLWSPGGPTAAIHLDFRRLTVTREYEGGQVSHHTIRRPGPLGGCAGGRFEAYLASTGELFACPHRPERAGRLPEASFSDLWDDSPVFAAARQEADAACAVCDAHGACCACGPARWAWGRMEEHP